MVLEESRSTIKEKGGHTLTVLPLVEMGEEDAWSHFVVLVTQGALY
jgi:hypothetical protein